MKKAWKLCLGIEPGPHDGNRRQIHWAMAASRLKLHCNKYCLIESNAVQLETSCIAILTPTMSTHLEFWRIQILANHFLFMENFLEKILWGVQKFGILNKFLVRTLMLKTTFWKALQFLLQRFVQSFPRTQSRAQQPSDGVCLFN